MLFGQDRGALRERFLQAKRKLDQGAPLDQLEALIAGVIELHPEYHALLDEGAEARERDWTPEDGEANPFLHMSLHIAVHEQLAVDRPPGIRARHQQLATRLGDAHAADHELIEALAETLWEAQGTGREPDLQVYLERVDRRVAGG